MKFKTVSALVSSALLASAMLAIPAVQAQGMTPDSGDVIIIGASPDTVTTMSNGQTMTGGSMNNGGMNNSPGMMTGSGSMAGNGSMGTAHVNVTGPTTVQTIEGDWVPQFMEPVISGLVIDNQIQTERAYVQTKYGYVSVPTSAGVPVIYKDRIANWLTVPVGQIVQLPLSTIVRGSIPHKVHLTAPTTSSYYMLMHSGVPDTVPFTGTVGSNGVSMNVTGANPAPDHVVAVVVNPDTGASDTVLLNNNNGAWSGSSTTLPNSPNGYIVTLYTFDNNGNLTSTSRQMVGGMSGSMAGAGSTGGTH